MVNFKWGDFSRADETIEDRALLPNGYHPISNQETGLQKKHKPMELRLIMSGLTSTGKDSVVSGKSWMTW